MRLLCTLCAIFVATITTVRSEVLSEDAANAVAVARATYDTKKEAVRRLLIDQIQAAKKPQEIVDAQSALEVFDQCSRLSRQSPKKARDLFTDARRDYLNALIAIQQDAEDPSDKLAVSKLIVTVHEEEKIDLTGSWEMQAPWLPKGARRIYRFKEEGDGVVSFSIDGDPNIETGAGVLKWDSEWESVGGTGNVVFSTDPTRKQRTGTYSFTVVDDDTLKGSHPWYSWDEKGREVSHTTKSSTLRRLKPK